MDIDQVEIDFEAVYMPLYFYTKELINSMSWYLKLDNESSIKGKKVEDYVMEAIERHLRNPRGFRPNSGTLLNYLKLSVVRNLVRVDARGQENRDSRDLLAQQIRYENTNDSYLDGIYPVIENTFGDEIDLNLVLAELEKEVNNAGNKALEDVYLGVCVYNMKRGDIMDEFDLSEKDYLNAYRRLGTIRKRVQKMFNINRS